MAFPENLKRLRLIRGLTQKQLGEKAGISNRIICKYELGDTEPHLSRIEWLAGALGVKPSELID